jgi:hydrogenase maturation protein HypF
MAEHGLAGPVIGITFDGTGLGTDGTAWGGEFLVADLAGFQRVASLRPVALPGGDQAIRQVWRLALALLDDAFEGAPPLDGLALFKSVPEAHVTLVRRMLAERLNTPLAHGAGRYFDAIGALALATPRSAFEGQVAMQCNFAAAPTENGVYDFALDTSLQPWSIDLRPMVRQATQNLVDGQAGAVICARFHNTLVAATAQAVRMVRQQFGHLPVVLTGGCFANQRLTESLLTALSPEFGVYLHGLIPPGDGGLALGQVVVSHALLARC